MLQVAEDDCGAVLANEMDVEPYFVDFMRDAPEATGIKKLTLYNLFDYETSFNNNPFPNVFDAKFKNTLKSCCVR